MPDIWCFSCTSDNCVHSRVVREAKPIVVGDVVYIDSAWLDAARTFADGQFDYKFEGNKLMIYKKRK